ncbi:MAG: pyruvate kinase [Bryobacterales bacterium]|nr:pyruvate kinase [Bryobacterales bacterium]
MDNFLPPKKTKIVCTIGPASESTGVLEQLIAAGMNIARVNFAHGDLETHGRVIASVRAAARTAGRRVAIFGDLPGPKMRIGEIPGSGVELARGQSFVLQSAEAPGDANRVSHSFPELPRVVKPGDSIYLNDGYIQLRVERVEGEDVHCRVLAGGPLSSRKGMNLPGISLGISAFTGRDRELLRFAAEQGLDGVSQSFVQDAADIDAVRQAAAGLGYHPFVIAKIERAGALDRLEEILKSADGIMVARGDLGVEIPIEQVAVTQKRLINLANRRGKPVITATHMLESMIHNRRPTRAEATDVANAILDGTDCVMLSGETAVGAFPVDAVSTMARIAAATEADRKVDLLPALFEAERHQGTIDLENLVSLNAYSSTRMLKPAIVFTPARSGQTARLLSRFHLPVWIVAFSDKEEVCQRLQFSYGVHPVCVCDPPAGWLDYARQWSRGVPLNGPLALLLTGIGSLETGGLRRLEVFNLTSA